MALLLAGIYFSTFVWLESKDWSRQDYSYGYIVPIVSLYLIWDKRRNLQELSSEPSWAGYLVLIAGLALFWLGELSGEFFTLYISLWMAIVGLCWINLGWAKLKTIAFALAMLLSMFPPPNFIHVNLTFKLKLISSQIGVWMLHLYGMSAFRDGNIIDLGFTQLQVVDACSGLRYLYPLIIMGLLLAYFYRAALWKKAVLVASTVPLTIVTNSLRIAMTGILYEVWGAQVAEDFFHGFSGWLIFMFALAVLLLEMWVLKRIFPGEESLSLEKSKFEGESVKIEPELAADGRELPQAKEWGPAPAPKGHRAFFHPPQFVVAVLLLAGTLALAQTVEFREKVPAAKSFAEFPVVVGEWSGKRDVMEEKFVNALNFSDYVMADYVDGKGRGVNFYTAFYESQRKGESIHSPETCLPGGGWEFRGAGAVRLPVKDRRGEEMRVNRAFIVKGPVKQLSYFWFPQRDRVLTNAWELKWYNFWDALTRKRTDGALVRLITPVYPNESVEDADKRLVDFTKEIVPILNEFLPK